MKDGSIKAMFAMGCITILESIALMQGIDGQLFTIVTAVVGGLGGYVYAKKTE